MKATEAGGLAVIAGEAGTGKSTTLAAVRDAYEAAGYRVIGMAWTNAIVQNLQRDGFGHATTIAAELKRLESGAGQWDGRTVLIVDEAAMLSTRHLAAVTAQARAAGAKLILAGDDRQLASIERGGMFGALKERHGAAELHEVARVSDAEQKRAFNLMHRGEFLPALAILSRQGAPGAIRWSGRQEEAFDSLVAQWAADNAGAPDKSRFVFAYTNADVAELNAALRQARAGQGALGPDRILLSADGPSAFAANDRIQFTATSRRADERRAGIVNGAVGTIRAIEGNRITVALDGRPGARERLVSFVAGTDQAAGEFGQFRHGYAGTIYKGQGRTLDQPTSITASIGAARRAMSRSPGTATMSRCLLRPGWPRPWPARASNGAHRRHAGRVAIRAGRQSGAAGPQTPKRQRRGRGCGRPRPRDPRNPQGGPRHRGTAGAGTCPRPRMDPIAMSCRGPGQPRGGQRPSPAPRSCGEARDVRAARRANARNRSCHRPWTRPRSSR